MSSSKIFLLLIYFSTYMGGGREEEPWEVSDWESGGFGEVLSDCEIPPPMACPCTQTICSQHIQPPSGDCKNGQYSGQSHVLSLCACGDISFFFLNAEFFQERLVSSTTSQQRADSPVAQVSWDLFLCRIMCTSEQDA
jgi:hypothetical protein